MSVWVYEETKEEKCRSLWWTVEMWTSKFGDYEGLFDMDWMYWT